MYYTSSSDTWLVFAHAKAFFELTTVSITVMHVISDQHSWFEKNIIAVNTMWWEQKNLNIPETEVKAKVKSH